MTTKEDILSQLEELRAAVRERALTDNELEELAAKVAGLKETVAAPPRAKHSIRELKGLGKEYWRGIDVERYLKEERESWD